MGDPAAANQLTSTPAGLPWSIGSVKGRDASNLVACLPAETAPGVPGCSAVACWGLAGGLLGLGAASVALYTVPSLQLANRYTVMAAAFIPYGLAAFAGASLIFATSPRRRLGPVALLALAGVAAQVWWAKPYWPAPAAEQRSGSTTILTMNMRCNPPGAGDLMALVDRVRPDVAVVQGLWAEGRESLGSRWGRLMPYRTFHPMQTLPTAGRSSCPGPRSGSCPAWGHTTSSRGRPTGRTRGAAARRLSDTQQRR